MLVENENAGLKFREFLVYDHNDHIYMWLRYDPLYAVAFYRMIHPVCG